MTRIQPIDPASATGPAKQLLDGVQKALGFTPNLMKTLAQAPAALEGYLSLNKALAGGALPAPFREQLAIATAQANACDYCLSAHTAIGKGAGLDPASLAAARRAEAPDPKAAAGLRFSREILSSRGQVSDASLAHVRQAGFTDPEITEIVAHVALNILTNYFNNVAGTEVDFPKVSAAGA
jgi:uncharacterized peroxidase-related enzyme